MNDKDKEAFDEWRSNHTIRLDIYDAWQAACEHKQIEVEGLNVTVSMATHYYKKLEAENKRLREALEFYADYKNWKFEDESACVIYMDGEPYPSHINGRAIRGFEELRVSGKRAREALKEVKEKLKKS